MIFPFAGNIEEGAAKFTSLYDQPGMADMGILVLSQSLRVHVADGQHRVAALQALMRELDWLRDEAVDLFLVEESNVQQQRTDFLDAAKVLPINATLQAWFDSGVALNVVIHKVVNYADGFVDDDIEKFKLAFSGKRNPKLWTSNNFRGYVGAALVKGSPQKTEDLANSFERTIPLMGWTLDSNEIDEFARELASYLDIMFRETAGAALESAREHRTIVDWNDL